MTTREVINTHGSVVPADAIEQLQKAFRGELIRPGDATYESARKIWNASIDKHPGIIARCSGTADVIAAVKKKYDPANFFRLNQNIQPWA